jgi:predicted GIY-YIG superfamily endonuclease
MSIYMLQLQEGKWYVGSSQNVNERYKQHVDGLGPEWTQTYKPLRGNIVRQKGNGFHEDMYTKKLMARYGIENVRGGAYCSVILSPETIEHLRRELTSSSGACYHCEKTGHFSDKCPDKGIATSPLKMSDKKIQRGSRQRSRIYDMVAERKGHSISSIKVGMAERKSVDTVKERKSKPVERKSVNTPIVLRLYRPEPLDGCLNCGELDHVRPDCPTLTCYKCRHIGHYANECPDL